MDQMVKQIKRNEVEVGENIEIKHLALRRGELKGKRGLIGERGYQLELLDGE